MGLPTWNKPSFACLSSRFQYGDAITPEKLRQVDAAEVVLRELGFRRFRVRHHDRVARIELPFEDMPRLWADGRHAVVVKRSGAIFDLTDSYHLAFVKGIVWNLLNLAIALWLLGQPRRIAAMV
ncbi:MAG: hypothetical protein ACREKS_03225 [Candidatus Rokuibacteriota bacterium]